MIPYQGPTGVFKTGSQPTEIAAQKKQGGVMDSVGNLLKNPFLMNLLAQSGYSSMPSSPVGAVGRAMIGAQQMEQASTRAGLEDELLRARIGLTNAQAEAGGANAAAGNIQSTFRGSKRRRLP